MIGRLHEIHGDERGMALVVSLMVAFVVLMLSTIVVAQSIHSLDSSGMDRRRLTAVNAAEAGTAAWWEDLQTTSLATLDCAAKTQTLESGPSEASFTAEATFYAADGVTPMDCVTFSSSNAPQYVKVTSTGTSEGGVPREMETFARLSPIRGGTSAAILSNGPIQFVNSLNVFGNAGNDGDVYVLNGNLTASNSSEVRGNVYVPNGTASLGNSVHVYGDLWVSGSVTLTNGVNVDRDLKSNSGSVTLRNSATVGRDAYSGTTISLMNSAKVVGTQYPNYTTLPAVPTQTFPGFNYVRSDWEGLGYTIHEYQGSGACTDAYNFLRTGTITSKTVVRITGSSPCPLKFQNSNTMTFTDDLAVITDWGIEMGNSTTWRGSGGIRKLMLLSTQGASCPSGSSHKNIIETNSTSYVSVEAMIYTPCNFTARNSSIMRGQVIAGTVTISNSFTMTYAPVLVPGLGNDIIGFAQDIQYVREV